MLQKVRNWLQKHAPNNARSLAVAVIAVIAILGLILFATSKTEVSSLPQLQTASARVGGIEITINTVGSIKPAREQRLTFSTDVTLSRLYVVEGEKVQAGDVLARIDATALERAVTQAEADLTVAQDNLEKALNPYTELDLTQAKVAVAQAEVALEEAKENLEKVRNPATELDLTQAKLAVAQAELDLAEAKENLEEVRNPATELDLTQARLAVAQAQLDLAEAKENLETLLNPDIEAAQAAVRDAEAALESARNQLVVVENDPDNAARLRTLEAEADWYRNNYWEAQKKFEQGKIDQGKLNWEYSNMLAAEERLRVARAQAESSLANAQNKVTQAEEALRDAQENLAALQSGPDALELTRAETRVTRAEYNLAKAQETLADLEAGLDPLDLAEAETQVAQAKYNLAKAQETLAEIEAGPDPLELTRAETQVDQAKADLREKEEMLAKIKAGPDAEELKEAQNRLEKAEIPLEEARRNLENATLVAPFSGTITSIDANEGDRISANSKILHLVDLSHLRVDIHVDEFDVGKVKVGQQATILPDVLPDQTLAGKVSKVAVMPAEGQGIAVYPVTIDISNRGHGVRPGMGAAVNIVVTQKANVLLIPNFAIKESRGEKVVYVLSEDQITAVPVTPGISDGEVTEIVKGLEEGKQVITSSEEVIKSHREYLEAGEKGNEGFWQMLKRLFKGLLGLGGE